MITLWAMLYLETLSLAIQVDISLTQGTNLNIVASQIHTFMAVAFSDGSGLF